MKLAILVLLVAACSGSSRDHNVRATQPLTAAPAPAPTAAPLGPSIYEVPLPLRDADGREIGLDLNRGHRVVVSMFYGSCAMACPALIGYLKQIAASAGDETRVLLVSFDAARDTPAHLRELAATHALDRRWTLASAAPTDARTLAALLGIKYRATAAGEFVHNSVIVALDAEGRPMARLDGLRDSQPLLAALTRPAD
jgi:protein SCO1